jgi:hypothetical protein
MKFLERMSTNERTTFLLTCIIGFFTLVNAIATVGYYCAFKKASTEAAQQTNKLIKAANIQACAAESFAVSASNINAGVGTAVDKLNLQAEKLEASVKQATRLAAATEKANANFLNSDRPWMGSFFSVDGFATGKTPTYSVTFINSGKRPARVTRTETLAAPIDFGENPTYRVYDVTPSITVIVPGQAVGASWKDDTDLMNPISDKVMGALTSGAIPFRIYARVEYTDLRTNIPYWTHACWRYTPQYTAINSGFSNCKEYNDAK